MHAPEIKARGQLAAIATPLLADMLRILSNVETLNAEQRMVRAWIIDALEDRYPAASKAVADAFLAAELALMNAPDGFDPDGAKFDVDYVAVLLGAIAEQPHS